MSFITNYMAETLSQAGVKDLRQLGMKEIQGEPVEQRIKKEGNKYYRYSQGVGKQTKTEINPKDLIDIKETEGASLGYGAKEKIITAKIKPPIQRILINKDTGEQVVQGKYGGVLGYGNDQDKSDGLLRWGNTTQTEGMTDFMIQFDKDGQALIVPKYSDTATDLTGITMVASVALAAYGVPAVLGKASGVTAAFGQTAGKAFGNALVNASFSAIQGQDFTKSFGKSLLTSAALPAISSKLDKVMGNTIFKNVSTDSLFREVAGGAINRSITSGIYAAVTGQDVGKAMMRGAASGAIKGGSARLVKSIFDENDLKFITDNTNLSYNQAVNIASLGLRSGVMNLTQGRNFTDGVGSMMVAYGVSDMVGNGIQNRLGNKMKSNPLMFNFIKSTSKTLTGVYIKSAIKGKPVTPQQLQQIFLDKALRPIKTVAKKKIKQTINIPKEFRKKIKLAT